MGIFNKLFGPKELSPEWFQLALSQLSVRASVANISSSLRAQGCPRKMIPNVLNRANAELRKQLMEQRHFQVWGHFASPLRCSDSQCPCPGKEALLPGSSAYLYISEEVVKFRQDAITYLDMQGKIERLKSPNAIFASVGTGVANPIFLCREGALGYGLNLDLSLKDAKQCIEIGFVPLRPSPKN